MACDAHNMWKKADRECSFVAHVDAAAALQAFCLEMGLSTKEAERAIFTARLQADVAADELDIVCGAKNGKGWVEAELTEIRASGEGADKVFSNDCKDHVD